MSNKLLKESTDGPRLTLSDCFDVNFLDVSEIIPQVISVAMKRVTIHCFPAHICERPSLCHFLSICTFSTKCHTCIYLGETHLYQGKTIKVSTLRRIDGATSPKTVETECQSYVSVGKVVTAVTNLSTPLWMKSV